MAVGFPTKVDYATGDVLSADNMNDLSGTVNLLESAQYAAGKNKIINGDFGIWQRGTSFATNVYCADRWLTESDGTAPVTQQTFTAGTAPVAGYEGTFFLRQARTASGSFQIITQRIEDVRTFAGQTVTVSFYAKADSSVTNEPGVRQVFGGGGSSTVEISGSTQTITTSWARYSFTVSVPSISGKTIGTNSNFSIRPIRIVDALAHTVDVWGVQVEAGSTASPFQTATGTVQGELAACQRYYQRVNLTTGAVRFGVGASNTTTGAAITFIYPVTMRIRPTALEQSGVAGDYQIVELEAITTCSAVPIFAQSSLIQLEVGVTVASGLTAGRFARLRGANSNGFLGWSAEL
jgi:hypothetical protein